MIYPLAARRGMITPLARGIQRAASGWWLAGGISAANCVAAYQAKGAASKGASLVNLANPGTYNNTETGTVTWSTEYGWYGFASDKYLSTGISPGQLWSMIVRTTNSVTTGYQLVCGCESSGGDNRFALYPVFNSSYRVYGAGGYVIVSGGSHPNGISAIAGRQGYWNGSADGNETNAAYSGDPSSPLLIGLAINDLVHYWKGAIQALSVYNTSITANQVAAVTTAMAAL